MRFLNILQLVQLHISNPADGVFFLRSLLFSCRSKENRMFFDVTFNFLNGSNPWNAESLRQTVRNSEILFACQNDKWVLVHPLLHEIDLPRYFSYWTPSLASVHGEHRMTEFPSQAYLHTWLLDSRRVCTHKVVLVLYFIWKASSSLMDCSALGAFEINWQLELLPDN